MRHISAIDTQLIKVMQSKKLFVYVSFLRIGMCQLPEFKQFPLYHPSMTFSQVIPKLSSRGRDLLQVRTNEKRVYADFECLRICYHNLIVKIYNIFCILAFIDLQSCASVISRWIYGASVLPRPQPFHQKLLANKRYLPECDYDLVYIYDFV